MFTKIVPLYITAFDGNLGKKNVHGRTTVYETEQ
jgi:hypothetical protein